MLLFPLLVQIVEVGAAVHYHAEVERVGRVDAEPDGVGDAVVDVPIPVEPTVILRFIKALPTAGKAGEAALCVTEPTDLETYLKLAGVCPIANGSQTNALTQRNTERYRLSC